MYLESLELEYQFQLKKFVCDTYFLCYLGKWSVGSWSAWFIYLFISLFIYLFICLFIYLFTGGKVGTQKEELNVYFNKHQNEIIVNMNHDEKFTSKTLFQNICKLCFRKFNFTGLKTLFSNIIRVLKVIYTWNAITWWKDINNMCKMK